MEVSTRRMRNLQPARPLRRLNRDQGNNYSIHPTSRPCFLSTCRKICLTWAVPLQWLTFVCRYSKLCAASVRSGPDRCSGRACGDATRTISKAFLCFGTTCFKMLMKYVTLFTFLSGIPCSPLVTTQNRLLLFQLNVITVEHFYEILKLHNQSQAPVKPGRSQLSGIHSLFCY